MVATRAREKMCAVNVSVEAVIASGPETLRSSQVGRRCPTREGYAMSGEAGGAMRIESPRARPPVARAVGRLCPVATGLDLTSGMGRHVSAG